MKCPKCELFLKDKNEDHVCRRKVTITFEIEEAELIRELFNVQIGMHRKLGYNIYQDRTLVMFDDIYWKIQDALKEARAED